VPPFQETPSEMDPFVFSGSASREAETSHPSKHP
jgi:hypothetical protein